MHIGNVIRLAAIMEPAEVATACEARGGFENQELLIEPTQTAADEAGASVNGQLLNAFRQFHESVMAVKEAMDPDCNLS